MIKSLGESMLDQIQNAPNAAEFSKAYLYRLRELGMEIVNGMTGRDYDFERLTDAQLIDLAYRLCRKLSGTK